MELKNAERGPTAALTNGASGSFTCDREKERDFICTCIHIAIGALPTCSRLHHTIFPEKNQDATSHWLLPPRSLKGIDDKLSSGGTCPKPLPGSSNPNQGHLYPPSLPQFPLAFSPLAAQEALSTEQRREAPSSTPKYSGSSSKRIFWQVWEPGSIVFYKRVV